MSPGCVHEHGNDFFILCVAFLFIFFFLGEGCVKLKQCLP